MSPVPAQQNGAVLKRLAASVLSNVVIQRTSVSGPRSLLTRQQSYSIYLLLTTRSTVESFAAPSVVAISTETTARTQSLAGVDWQSSRPQRRLAPLARLLAAVNIFNAAAAGCCCRSQSARFASTHLSLSLSLSHGWAHIASIYRAIYSSALCDSIQYSGPIPVSSWAWFQIHDIALIKLQGGSK